MTWLRFGSLLLAALSLGPSFAHVLEAPPRLTQWPAELWREATVFNGQYQYFAFVGGPLDVAIVIVSAVYAYVARRRSSGFGLALAGAICFALALAAWGLIVAPANSILATWTPGPLAENFREVQLRWETGHMVVATLKVVGFSMLALSMLLPSRGSATSATARK